MECAMEGVETSNITTPNKAETCQVEQPSQSNDDNPVNSTDKKAMPPPEPPSQTKSSGKESTSQKVPSPEEMKGENPPVSHLSSLFGSSEQTASTSSSAKLSPLPSSPEQAESESVTNGPVPKKQRVDCNSMSTGVYLDSTVVPILHASLVTLDRLRPDDPVQFVIDYLLRHKAKFTKTKEQPASSTSVSSTSTSLM